MNTKDLLIEIGKEFIKREQLLISIQETNGKIQALYAKLQGADNKEKEAEKIK